MNYTKWITRTGVLLALTLVVQMLGFPPFITGPLVNMLLFISAMSVGWLSAILIGGLTPWIALIRGILPPPLAPVIPFIIIGNILLAIIYYLLQNKSRYLGVILASITKFGILSFGISFLVQIPPKIAKIMQLPQLLTALVGGLLAIFLAKVIARSTTDDEDNIVK